jgi:hypothetical protein
VKECLESKIKKQNMEKFMFNLVYLFLNKKNTESKILYRVYSKVINKHLTKPLVTYNSTNTAERY